MSWAAERRFIIFSILGGVIVAFLLVVSFATFYETPSCTDAKQNQDETGVDCGGACSLLCNAELEPPTVLFTAALSPSPGRADVVALVENKNTEAAAQAVPYRINVYGIDRSLLYQASGTLDLPPGATMPVFVPGIPLGKQQVASAFLEIDPADVIWFTLPHDPRIVPSVANITQTIGPAPRISAVLTNPSTETLKDVKVIVLVYGTKGQVIGASQTLVESIPPQGRAQATFTWNTAFPGTSASLRVFPIVPL